MSSSEEVLELSIEETNALRSKLGLAPLRIKNVGDDRELQQDKSSSSSSSLPQEEEQLSLSVDETNALREKLGLRPLNNDAASASNHNLEGRSARTAIHVAPTTTATTTRNGDVANNTAKRIQDAKLAREVKSGISRMAREAGVQWKGSSKDDNDNDNDNDNNDDDGGDVLDWAKRMRRSAAQKQKDSKKKQKAASSSSSFKHGKGEKQQQQVYGNDDLEGIQVEHSAAEFEAGSTTILTLQDAPLLERDEASGKAVGLAGDNDEDDGMGTTKLQNVNLAEDSLTKRNLKKKRAAERILGRAGGYTGIDDEEFDDYDETMELGGTGGGKGFAIGKQQQQEEEATGGKGSGLFAFEKGKAISLEDETSGAKDPAAIFAMASDFMTVDEDEEEKRRKKAKKESKKKKFKKLKKEKKRKKSQRRDVLDDDDDNNNGDDYDEGKNEEVGITATKTAEAAATAASFSSGQEESTLLQELERTAQSKQELSKSEKIPPPSSQKKRRREAESDNDEEEEDYLEKKKVQHPSVMKDVHDIRTKKAKFHDIMEKGNVRTQKAFPTAPSTDGPEENDDVEQDDAFLNAALTKARRLRRLREMNGARKGGADAVAEALEKQKVAAGTNVIKPSSSSSSFGDGGVTFEFDETREFTRALEARAQQEERRKAKEGVKKGERLSTAKPTKQVESGAAVDDKESNIEEDVTMEDLAKQIDTKKEDAAALAAAAAAGQEMGGFDATAKSSVPVGRGLGNVLNMLRHTGEITGKNAGKEELRGRAKDERTYEDYEALDLSQVVRVDPATEKDRDLASREIKLEYRDEYGRLLTRKEAFRNLSYQFHGYGSSTKNEERRLKQIARERAEAAVASRQGAAGGAAHGTLGALKATQKATGKAFVVHRT